MVDEIIKELEDNGQFNEMIEWLKDHAIEIKTAEPKEDQQDLDVLKNMIGNSEV